VKAGGRARTSDPDAGSAALCQLSYTREHPHRSVAPCARPWALMDAAEFDPPPEPLVLYFFNPLSAG
jgi:hypothetical protein